MNGLEAGYVHIDHQNRMLENWILDMCSNTNMPAYVGVGRDFDCMEPPLTKPPGLDLDFCQIEEIPMPKFVNMRRDDSAYIDNHLAGLIRNWQFDKGLGQPSFGQNYDQFNVAYDQNSQFNSQGSDSDKIEPDTPSTTAEAPRQRRRRNINGSTRMKRRRQRARMEAELAAGLVGALATEEN